MEIYLQIAILLAVLYVGFVQEKKYKSVRDFMSIFDLDWVEKYVKMSEKTIRMEKEDALKAVEKEMKSKADKGIQLVLAEMKALSGVLIKLSFVFATNPYFEKSINEMENVIWKQNLLEIIQKQKEKIKDSGIGSQPWIVHMAVMNSILSDKIQVKERFEAEIEGNKH